MTRTPKPVFVEPVRRGRAFLGGLLVLTTLTWIGWLDLEVQTGIGRKLLSAPLVAFAKSIEQSLNPSPLPTPYKSNRVATSSATPQASVKPSAKPTVKPKTATPQVKIIYVTPRPLPTAKPGDPGSPEWDAEFKRKWDEMSARNAEMQQKVEASQKQFCIDNPNLCK